MTFRLVFDPISGTFEVKRIETNPVSGVAFTVVQGILVVSSGTQIQIQGEILINETAEIFLETGGDLLIL